MNRKFKHDQYQICVNFKSENALAISVQFSPTGEYFANESVELMRIKKDTVIATLERKSEKNLRCEIDQLVEGDVKFATIKFIVNYDFLPEFHEEIKLEYVEKKNTKNLSIKNFHTEIQDLERIIEQFETSGVIDYSQIGGSNNLSNGKIQIWRKELKKGKFLIKVCGVYTNGNGVIASDQLTFSFHTPHQEVTKSSLTSYNMHGYSYPFNFSEILEVDDGESFIEMESTGGPNCTISNSHVTLTPIFELV